LTGVSFNHSEDYTERGRDWREAENYQIATEYEDCSMNQTVYGILSPLISIDDYLEEGDDGYYIEDFEGLWWAFVKLSLPDVTYKLQKDEIPNINGYWGELNCQFGYGLFS
jgi:hypothetical protein